MSEKTSAIIGPFQPQNKELAHPGEQRMPVGGAPLGFAVPGPASGQTGL